MTKITFMPMNLTFDAKSGESVLDVAIANDVPLQHACGGFCACTTCHILVKEGMDLLTSMSDDEEERLDRATGVTLKSRLGCQAKLSESTLASGSAHLVVEVVNEGTGH